MVGVLGSRNSRKAANAIGGLYVAPLSICIVVLTVCHSHQVVGSIVGIIGIIVIAVAVGVSVSKSHKSSNDLSSSSSSGSGTNGSSVNQSNPNDPSTFEKDPNLKQSFYGIAYTPEGSQYPACGNSLCKCFFPM